MNEYLLGKLLEQNLKQYLLPQFTDWEFKKDALAYGEYVLALVSPDGKTMIGINLQTTLEIEKRIGLASMFCETARNIHIIQAKRKEI